jgi:uncharacterized membrane protein
MQMATRVETNELLQTRLPRVLGYRTPHEGVRTTRGESLARGLGWFSIGLGLAETAAPKMVARLTGSRKHESLIRSYGVREIAAGIGILTRPRPAGFLWARVAGDAVDLASLGYLLRARKAGHRRAAVSLAAVAGVTALDIVCARQLSRGTGFGGTVRVETSIITNRSPEECYRFWRNFENLPRFMSYLQSVRITGDRNSHWIARGPGDTRIEWDAEMLDDVPNQRITWRSLPGSEFVNSGSVSFERAPGNRGTVVRVQFDYGQPRYALASAVAKLVGKEPGQLVNKDLRRFKQVLETGDVVTTEGQPAGRTSGATWLDSIAR